MKKEKKLKLDTLSSNELASKEAAQITGGASYCYCLVSLLLVFPQMKA